MTLRYATILLSLVTILSLNLILLLGSVVRDPQSIRPVFNGVVLVLDLSLVSSSDLLGFLLINESKVLAVLFWLNIGLFVMAFVLRISGVLFPPLLLYGTDLYWLNLYVATLARHGHTIARRAPRKP